MVSICVCSFARSGWWCRLNPHLRRGALPVRLCTRFPSAYALEGRRTTLGAGAAPGVALRGALRLRGGLSGRVVAVPALGGLLAAVRGLLRRLGGLLGLLLRHMLLHLLRRRN